MSVPSEKGLENRPGQNNCFLNVCIQALWHLESFRSKFLSRGSHVHAGRSCIYCALKTLFTRYQFSDDEVLPPTALRKCLGILYKSEDRFQMGDLDDAAEALEAILTSLNKVYLTVGSTETDETHPDTISNKVFGCPILERIHCSKCKAVSKPSGADMFIYYAYVEEIRSGYRRFPHLQFDSLLKRLNEEERKSCPNEETGLCTEKKCPVHKYLLQQPEVFAIGLVWVVPNPSSEEIVDMLSIVSQRIRLSNMFDGVPVQFTYRLKGMICYYGLHYDCYFYSPLRQKWLVFDDTVVKEVGASWEKLVRRCERGRFHPSVLFYERVEQGVPLPPTIPNVGAKGAAQSVAASGASGSAAAASPAGGYGIVPMQHGMYSHHPHPAHQRVFHPAYAFPPAMMPPAPPMHLFHPQQQQAPSPPASSGSNKPEDGDINGTNKSKHGEKKKKKNERSHNASHESGEEEEEAESDEESRKKQRPAERPLTVSLIDLEDSERCDARTPALKPATSLLIDLTQEEREEKERAEQRLRSKAAPALPADAPDRHLYNALASAPSPPSSDPSPYASPTADVDSLAGDFGSYLSLAHKLDEEQQLYGRGAVSPFPPASATNAELRAYLLDAKSRAAALEAQRPKPGDFQNLGRLLGNSSPNPAPPRSEQPPHPPKKPTSFANLSALLSSPSYN